MDKTDFSAELVARFSFECLVYMQFHPCDCGGENPVDVKIRTRGNVNIAVYDGSCRSCQKPRHFEFIIGSDYDLASAIVDAGQWLLAAERIGRAVPADVGLLDDVDSRWAKGEMERAVVALEEALKFVPDDDDRVPFEALFSAQGKALYADEPGRFRRSRIAAVLATYRDSIERWPPPPKH